MFLFFSPILGEVAIQPNHAIKVASDEKQTGAPWCRPVLDGFAKAGLSGADIAHMVGVTTPTVSKWRRGLIHAPAPKVAFLTLILAHLLEELHLLMNSASASTETGATEWKKRAEIIFEVSGGLLKVQEQTNMEMNPGEVRVGAQMFREWWGSGAATDLRKILNRAISGTDPKVKST